MGADSLASQYIFFGVVTILYVQNEIIINEDIAIIIFTDFDFLTT